MTTYTDKPEPWQKDIQTSLNEISKSLKLLATVQTLSLLHSKEHLIKQAQRHQELRAAHNAAIVDMQATSERVKAKHGEDDGNYERLLAAHGKETADLIDADGKKAFEIVGDKHRELREFEANNPNIGTLSQFLVERDS